MVKLDDEWKRTLSVEEFIRALFLIDSLPDSSREAATALFNDFKDARVHFNHFLKIHERTIVCIERLLKLMFRGAAVVCADQQTGIDIVIPVFNGMMILIQVKNDKNFKSRPVKALFDAMDPVGLGMGKYNSVIRIIFALASDEANLEINTHAVTSQGRVFVAHDIWCAGVSHKHLCPVIASTEPIWSSLCDASSHWKNVFVEDGEEVHSRMHMKPGSADNDAFWSRWNASD